MLHNVLCSLILFFFLFGVSQSIAKDKTRILFLIFMGAPLYMVSYLYCDRLFVP